MDLGALGFWLFLGMIIAAGTVTEGLKARPQLYLARRPCPS